MRDFLKDSLEDSLRDFFEDPLRHFWISLSKEKGPLGGLCKRLCKTLFREVREEGSRKPKKTSRTSEANGFQRKTIKKYNNNKQNQGFWLKNIKIDKNIKQNKGFDDYISFINSNNNNHVDTSNTNNNMISNTNANIAAAGGGRSGVA